MEVTPHDILLFNLKSDPGEQINLANDEPEKLTEMLKLMENFADIGDPADHEFYNILREGHGDDYFKADF